MSSYIDRDIIKPNTPVAQSVPMAPTPPPTEPTASLGKQTDQDKAEQVVEPVQYYVKYTFMITYILLLTTATVTFIEALTTTNDTARHVLNLETCISIIAGYFYSLFLSQIDQYQAEGKKVDWAQLTQTRYVDWSITTPIMLLVLCAVLGKNIGKSVKLMTILPIVGLNYLMLLSGYLGESGVLNRIVSLIPGFGAFFGMFYLIYVNYVKPVFSKANYNLFYIYLGIWSLYGVVFMFNEEYKNIFTNILDAIAKSGLGLGLWVYYTKIITL